jgi:hypothetical protein
MCRNGLPDRLEVRACSLALWFLNSKQYIDRFAVALYLPSMNGGVSREFR